MQGIKKTFNRFSLDQKIFTLIIVEVIGFLIVAFVAASQVKSVGEQVEQIAEVALPLHISIENIRSHFLERRLVTKELILNASLGHTYSSDLAERSVAAYEEGEKEIQSRIQSAEKFIRKSVALSDQNDNAISLNSQILIESLFVLRRDIQKYDSLVTHLLEDLQSPDFYIKVKMLQGIEGSEQGIMSRLDGLTEKLELVRGETTRHAVYVKRIATGFIVLTILAAVLFFIAMKLLIIRRNISKPLQLLTDTINTFTATQKVEESEFERGLMVRGDELGRMSRSFNRLKHDLWSQGRDLHDAKEEAERANRAKSMFLASASHDLRQPLHAMQMYIAALRHKMDNAETLRIVDDIDAVSISTARLLSALLDVSQLEAGAIEPKKEDFLVEEVLNRAFREFAPAAREKNLDFQVISSSLAVRSDPVLLERILGNFISNAIRYTHEGRILLGVRRRGDKVSIEVWDTGQGIPENQTMAIFEDFHQIDNAERDRSKGLGLGLAIARRLAVCLSHDIECDSLFGQGSRFAVLVESGSIAASNAIESLTLDHMAKSLSGLRILLVEDNLDVLKSTQNLLTSWGCDVVSGGSLEEVIKVMDENSATVPNLILADYRLPGGADGVEVISRVQRMVGDIIPSIVVTGDVQESNLEAIASEGHQVLCKPVQPAKLRALISHMINSEKQLPS